MTTTFLLYKNNFILTLSTFCIYLLLACGMVYLPTAINLSSSYLGQGEVVFWGNYFWWFEFSIHNFINPLHNNFIFFPLGLYMTDGILPMLTFVPLSRLLGATASYNIYLLSTFALSGLSMFMLARKLSISYLPSLLSGIIFAFFPFHFGAAIGHLHTFSIMWIPFFVMTSLDFIDRPSARTAFMAALVFSFTALTSWTVAVMTALYFAIVLCFNWKSFKFDFCVKLLSLVCMSLLFMAPGIYPLISEIVTGEYTKPLEDFITYSGDLLSFVTPSPLHPIWGTHFQSTHSKFSGNISENLMFVGFTVLLLAAIGTVISRKTILGRSTIFITLFFFILSLGPVLHIGGNFNFTQSHFTVMLPGQLTMHLPIFNMIRVPSRYFIMVMLGLSILAAFGMDYISKALSQKFTNIPSLTYLMQICACILVLVEFMSTLPVHAAVKVPTFYQKLRKTSGHSPILTVPITVMGGNGRDFTSDAVLMMHYYEYQKIHQKPIFGGYWSRVANKYEKFLLADPILSYVYSQGKDIITYPQINPLVYLKQTYGTSHVVLHKSFMTDTQISLMVDYFGNGYYEDNSTKGNPLIIYSTFGATPSNGMKLGNGWHDIDYWKNEKGENLLPTRWMGDYGELIFNSVKSQTASLQFTAIKYAKDRVLAISLKNVHGPQEVFTTVVSDSSQTVTIPVNLSEGENIITLKSLGGSNKPCEDQTTKSNDCRDLSIAVQNIAIKPLTSDQ